MINIIIIVAVIIGGGLSYKAESALPGDNLYPIKTEVNERARGWLAISAEAESELAVKLAQRRLAEAKSLQAEGRLDAETRAHMEAEFENYAKEADREIDELESEGKESEASAMRLELENSIDISGDILGIKGEAEADAEVEISAGLNRTVKTEKGDFLIEFRDGSVILSGKIARANPCVEWESKTTISKDSPPSTVIFELTQKSTAEVCIQVLGEPQEISVKTPAAPTADITLKIEGKIVFAGKLEK